MNHSSKSIIYNFLNHTGTKELRSKDIDGTTLKVDNASIYDDQSNDENDSEEEESLAGSDQSDDGYETDNQSVDE